MIPNEILELASLMTFDEDKHKYTISILTEINKETYEPIHKIKLVFGIINIKKQNSFTYKDASMQLNKMMF